jgi:hypothetical protein
LAGGHCVLLQVVATLYGLHSPARSDQLRSRGQLFAEKIVERRRPAFAQRRRVPLLGFKRGQQIGELFMSLPGHCHRVQMFQRKVSP